MITSKNNTTAFDSNFILVNIRVNIKREICFGGVNYSSARNSVK